jgi:hypothetical protein
VPAAGRDPVLNPSVNFVRKPTYRAAPELNRFREAPGFDFPIKLRRRKSHLLQNDRSTNDLLRFVDC